MEEATFTLPDNFGIAHSDAAIYYYSNNRSSVKNKVTFTQHVCCLLLQGVKEVYTAGGRELITNRDLLLFGGGSVLMSESTATNGRYEAILLFFSDELLADVVATGAQPSGVSNAATPLLKISRDAFLDNYCQSLQLLQTAGNTSLHTTKIRELLQYLNIAFPETFRQLACQAKSNDQELQFRQTIESNADKGLSIPEMAFLCHMSVATFKRHFAHNYQTSPRQYFIKRRMERAQTLLRARQRPSAIYQELGYEHLAAFSNEFKKYTGITPGQFRQQFEPIAQVSDPIAQ